MCCNFIFLLISFKNNLELCNFISLYFYYRKYNNYYIYIHFLFIYFTAETFTDFIPKNSNSSITQNTPINQSKVQIKPTNNNNTLIQQLKDEKNKNNLIQQLNDERIKNNLIQQLNNERDKNKKLEEEIIYLRRELDKNQDQINELYSLKVKIKQFQKENQNLKEDNQMNINEINKLKQKINDLEMELQSTDKKKVYMNDIMVINFISKDQSIRTSIPCLPEDTFAEVEEKLYQKYDELRNTNNIFLFKRETILRFKKIKENNIKNNDIIQFIKPGKITI